MQSVFKQITRVDTHTFQHHLVSTMYVCVCTEKGEVVELTVDHIWQIPNATDQNLVRLAHSTG